MMPPRVLALTTSYPLRRQASAGVFIARLYRALRRSWQIEVVCPADDQAFVPEMGECAVRVHAVSYAPRSWRVLAQGAGGVLPGLRRAPWRLLLVFPLTLALMWHCLRRAPRADLIHANWAFCGAIAGLVGWMTGKPVVTSLRGDDVTQAAQFGLHGLFLRLALRSSQGIICVSTAMAETLRRRFPRWADRIHVGLNGVDARFFSVMRVPGPQDLLRVAAAGSLVRRKGFDCLIAALGRMTHASRVRLRIAGSGPERAALVQQARRLGVDARVEWVGPLAPEAMPEFLAQADLFVLPSRAEGRPNVVLEALASGLAVIASDLPEIRNLVRPGIDGWIVEAEDVDALAAALDQAAIDPVRTRCMGDAARERARSQVGGWTQTAAIYDAVFRKVLDMPGPGRFPCAG